MIVLASILFGILFIFYIAYSVAKIIDKNFNDGKNS